MYNNVWLFGKTVSPLGVGPGSLRLEVCVLPMLFWTFKWTNHKVNKLLTSAYILTSIFPHKNPPQKCLTRNFRPYYTSVLHDCESIFTAENGKVIHSQDGQGQNVTANLKAAHQSWMVRCSLHTPKFSRSSYTSLWAFWPFRIKPRPAFMEISTCRRENLDQS